jgi:hypothetical protein
MTCRLPQLQDSGQVVQHSRGSLESYQQQLPKYTCDLHHVMYLLLAFQWLLNGSLPYLPSWQMCYNQLLLGAWLGSNWTALCDEYANQKLFILVTSTGIGSILSGLGLQLEPGFWFDDRCTTFDYIGLIVTSPQDSSMERCMQHVRVTNPGSVVQAGWNGHWHYVGH